MKTKQEYANAYAFSGYILLLCSDHPKLEQAEDLHKKHGSMKIRLWLKQVRDANRHYLETGIGGGYDTARLVDSDWNGIQVPRFEDTRWKEENDTLCLERKMAVDGKVFTVSSIFPEAPAQTPTDKLLTLIDSTEKY